MYRARVMPCLLLRDAGLVKTVQFSKPRYIGDPINAIRIFNEKEVDELVLLDITASAEGREPPFDVISEIVDECFMPLTYGGGIQNLQQIERIFKLGVEKVCLNRAALQNPSLVTEAARVFGSQSIVVSMDVKRRLMGGYRVVARGDSAASSNDPVTVARQIEDAGAGELFLTSVDRDGTRRGYDLQLIQKISQAVQIPVIACGGANDIDDFTAAIKQAGASAVAAGSMFVFHGKLQAVLISYPKSEELDARLL